MPLADHLRELRNRLAKAMLAIVVVTIVAAFFYNDIINFLTKPILDSFSQVTMVTRESDVAEAVFRAANDVSEQLQFPAGADAVALARSTRVAPVVKG